MSSVSSLAQTINSFEKKVTEAKVTEAKIICPLFVFYSRK